MGCNSSSLANPSEFSHLTPSQPVTSSSLTKEPEPIESSLSAEAYTHAVPTMTRGERGDADNDLMGKYEEIGKPPKEPRVLLPHDFHFGHNKQDIYGSESHPKPTVPNGKRGYVVPFPRGKGRPSKEEWEAQEEEKARVKAAKAKEGRYGNLGKVAGLGEGERKDEESLAKGVWRKMKKGASNERGPGEEYDPITGRGIHTGMTKEETIEYVGRTRGAGMYSGKQFAFMGANEGGMGWGA